MTNRPLLIVSASVLSLVLGSVTSSVWSAPFGGKDKPIRDVAKHDDLSQKLRMIQQNDPLRELGPAAGNTEEDPSVKNAPKDFIENSQVLSFRGWMTFIPKRAVIHLPEKYEDRMKIERGAKVKTFQEFFAHNRGWIRTIEVSKEQAFGHKPFPEGAMEAVKNSSSVVVATFKKGPISVLPQKAPEEIPDPSELKPVTYAK